MEQGSLDAPVLDAYANGPEDKLFCAGPTIGLAGILVANEGGVEFKEAADGVVAGGGGCDRHRHRGADRAAILLLIGRVEDEPQAALRPALIDLDHGEIDALGHRLDVVALQDTHHQDGGDVERVVSAANGRNISAAQINDISNAAPVTTVFFGIDAVK